MPDKPPAPVAEKGYVNPAAVSAYWTILGGGPDEETTPELRWPASVRVYDTMRRQDAQTQSVLRAVTMPIRRTRWFVDPAGADPKVAREFAHDVGLPVRGEEDAPQARTRDRLAWGEHLRLALLQLAFGHMAFEPVYRYDEASGLFRLRKLSPRMPRSIASFNVARDGGLVSIAQHAGAGSKDAEVVIPVDRLVMYVHEREGANWQGTSLLRAAYKHWLLKDRALRGWRTTNDRNGSGVVVYEGAEGGDADDLKTGEEIARSVRTGEHAGVSVPFGAKLRLQGVEGDLPDIEAEVRYHDEQIARAVLAHFLNLGTQTGSWALGSTFADFFTDSLQGVAQSVADVASEHIAEDWVDYNYGTGAPAPRISFERIGTEQAATAAAIKALIDAGAIFPDRSLEEALRKQYGLPSKDQPPPATPAPPPAEED